MPVSLGTEDCSTHIRQSVEQSSGARVVSNELIVSETVADEAVTEAEDDKKNVDEESVADASISEVEHLSSNLAILRELYQLACRRSHDPLEGLAIQLEDALKILVNHWGMTIGFVGQVSDARVMLSSFGTSFARKAAQIDRSETTSLDLIRYAIRQLAQLPEDVADPSCIITSAYAEQLLLTPALLALEETTPPALFLDTGNPWDQLLAQARSYLGIPIIVHDQHFGTLGFLGVKARVSPFSADDLQLFALFADWVGSLLERTQSRSLRATEQSDLARINKEIAQSNSDLDHFVYIASHDLKEPLRGISQYAQFLTEDYFEQLDDEGKRMLTALIDQSQRMVTQIDDLRFYSRIGRHESGIDMVDLNDIVADVRARLHALISETGVGIHIPRSLPSVEGNGALITTVFQNLIANAARYNDKDHKWIQITWRYQVKESAASNKQEGDGSDRTDESNRTTDTSTAGKSRQTEVAQDANADDQQTEDRSSMGLTSESLDRESPDIDGPIQDTLADVIRNIQEGQARIVLTIADNGIGILQRDQEAIFTMFRRLHNQDDFGGGTGAGLAIVKRIIEQQGGQIWLDSEIGVGTQFHFTFE